jgi:hypothetical protein
LTAQGTTSKGTGSISCEVEFCIFYRVSLRTLRTKDVVQNRNGPQEGVTCVYVKGKAILVQASYRLRELQEVEAYRFWDSRHMTVVRLSVLRTGRLYPPGNIPGTYFC